ncbi:MAG TPA: hypothetical protein VIL35_12505 [Vicinamibacterales bacterium]
MKRAFPSRLAVLALLLLMAMPMAAAAEERFSAFAVNVSNIGTGSAGNVLIRIKRYSTEAERERLMTAMREKGEDGLLAELRKLPSVGGIRTPRSLEWDIRFAWQIKNEDGSRRVILLTDRPISFWEARNQPRTMNYPFTLIEMRLPAEGGKGEGKLSLFTRIQYDARNNIVELENYASEPVRLSEITVES